MPAKLIVYFRNEKLGIDLKDGIYRIGREAPADVVVPDSTMSSNHAELQVSGDTALLRDLGSTNGTFVNGTQIRAVRPVGEKDEIRFGGVKAAIRFPEEDKPAKAKPAASGPKRIAAVKQAGSRLRWTTKFLLAGVAPICALLVIFFFIQSYIDATAKTARVEQRFQNVAAQYVHVLRDPSLTAVPAPAIDESMQHVLIANRDGRILYPGPETAPDGSVKETPSPLIHPTTKKVFLGAKWELYEIPRAVLKKDDPPLWAYPVRAGGDLLGYVVGTPVGSVGSNLGNITALLLLAGIIGMIVLILTQRRAARSVRRHVHALAERFSPYVNGFLDALPRSAEVPELNEIADEFESSLRSIRSSNAGAGARGGQKGAAFAFAAPLVDLVDGSEVAYCFVDGDFKLLAANANFHDFTEFGRVVSGTSLFEGGLTAIQSKQLVQAIAEARREQKAATRMQLQWRGDVREFDVTVRATAEPGASQHFGMIFSNSATR